MENKLFRYDYNYKLTIITLVATIFFLFITICLHQYQFAVFLGSTLTILGFFGTVLIYNTGIHLNFKNEKVIIIDSFLIRTISMSDIKYISIEEDKKIRKQRKTIFSPDSIYGAYWTDYSKYVYRNGKTYRIIFHLTDNTLIESYYGWLFNAKSALRVEKQEKKINQMIQQFISYKTKISKKNNL